MNQALRNVLWVVALTGCGGCAQQEATPEAASSSTEPTPTVQQPEKTWEPSAFQGTEKEFRANPANRFFSEFSSTVEKSGKTEFETSQEYEARLDSTRFLEPFTTQSAYAIDIQYDSVSYDADKQEYSSYSGLWCQKGYPIKEGISCSISQVIDESEEYIGQNAFGTTAEVSRERGRDFYLVLDGSSRKHLETSKVSGSTLINTRCPVPVEVAKQINTKRVAIGLVIRLREPRILSGHTRYQEATVQNPTDKIFSSVGVPAVIVNTVCYNKDTLEILSIK